MSGIPRLEKEKRRAQDKDNLREVANLCNLLGQEYLLDGDYDEAISQHKEEAGICEALGDTVGVAVAIRLLGEVYCKIGDWDKGLQYQHRYLSLAKEANSLVEKQRAYATLGRTHYQRAEEFSLQGRAKEQEDALKEAEKACLRSLSVCEHLEGLVDTREHGQMRCRLYLNLGLILDSRHNNKKARNFIGQALDLCSLNGFHEDAYKCHLALSAIHFRERQMPEALQEGQMMLKLAIKLNDKELQCESHCFLAEVHITNSDYVSAKKSYHKAYKVKHPSLDERKRIESILKIVVHLCNIEDTLILLRNDECDEKLKIYESFGDGLAKLGHFSKALDYYHLMLNLALKLDKEPTFLCPIYSSLAQTYADNKQYDEAKEYFLKEYDIIINKDPSDACKTMLSLANVCENKGDEYSQLEKFYVQAKAAAIKGDNKKLQHKVLYTHASLKGIPEEVKLQLEEEMETLANTSGYDPDAETSEEEECDDKDEIDLDLVYFSDSENEQENFDRPRQARQKKTVIMKRNEKGETLLHKACITGNLNMVKKLIMKGHPVNPRDHCGWLPLHEAANHGFTEIVNVLLDAGAWINDRGGKQCEGVTPLHDAAACGNIEIVKLLLSRGASAIIKDDHGATPLEALVNFRKRSNLPWEEEQTCIALEEEMKAIMRCTGHKIPEVATKVSQKERRASGSSNTNKCKKYNLERVNSLDSNRSLQTTEELRKTGALGINEYSGYESDDCLPDINSKPREDVEEIENDVFDSVQEDSEEFMNPLLQDIQKVSQSATGTYLSAIGSVGSAAKRLELRMAEESSFGKTLKKEKKGGLVTESEDVGDDWLDDDLGITSKKRKRCEKFEFGFREPKKERRVLQEKRSQEKFPSRLKKSYQPRLTSMMQKSTVQERDSEDDVMIMPDNVVSTSQNNPVNKSDNSSNHRIDGKGTSPNGENSAVSHASCSALRLRVRVQNKLLLVPVAGGGQGRTVEWLAAEVTRRYYQLAGLRPHLTLTTQDGAVLDPSDPIALVLSAEQAELQAQVTGWDLPPLPERYSQACQSLGVVPVSCLTSALHQTEASTSLDLSRMGRLTTQLHPVLRGIQCQQSLHSLVLSNCCLGDDGFGHLMEALPTLPSLEILNLKCTSLTTSSLLSFTEAISSGGMVLKSLASLDLGYNNFSGAKVSDIGVLFGSLSLSSLSLKHCYLSLTGQHQLPVTSSAIKKLELDYNTIYDAPLTSLLSCVSQVSHLSLSGLNCRNDVEVKVRLGLALANVLGAGEECHLEFLDLSSSGLTDIDLEDISAYLYRCPHLTSINLSHNNQLSSASINTLLNELTTNMLLPLKSLSLHGIKSTPDVQKKIATVVQRKATQQNMISKLSVTQSGDDRMLEDIWKAHSTESATVLKIEKELFLSC
ncbi:tonsoku-like protein [Palaemon carinicauda]|uniref:tonsoku-like protein n=1 Tax=Palaemon carinicauda TaxID=392227 RepID=UPI0035B5C8A5